MPPLTRSARSGPAAGWSDALGFDVESRADFTLVIPFGTVPFRWTIYTVPANLSYAEVRLLAVVGDLPSTFLNNVTWRVTVTRAGPQEHLMQSIEEGVARSINMAGKRWAPMGSLQEPYPVVIRLSQGEVLGGEIIAHTALTGTPLTVYSRASGQVYR